MTMAGENARTRTPIAPLCALILLFGILVWPLIGMPASRQGTATDAGHFPSAQMGDQIRWHEPAVRLFAKTFPKFDFAGYASAIAPGYYVFMATIAQIEDSRLTLQFINSLFGLALVVLVWWVICEYMGGWPALIMVLPLVVSSYTIATSVWLNPDNIALLLVTGTLVLLVMMEPSPRLLVVGALSATATVFARQIHLWVIAPAVLAIVLALPCVSPRVSEWIFGTRTMRVSWLEGIGLALVVLLPFALIAHLVIIWGGLVPPIPTVREIHQQGMNPAAFAFAPALFGVFGVFFTPLVERDWRKWIRIDPVILIAIGVALVACLAQPTIFDPDEGRFGGALWTAVRLTDSLSLANRSLLLVPLAIFGAVFLVHAWRAAKDAGRQRAATALLLSMLGWLTAQSVNTMVWQRYYEPIILIAICFLTALGHPRKQSSGGQVALGAVALLILIAIGQLALSVAHVYAPVLAG